MNVDHTQRPANRHSKVAPLGKLAAFIIGLVIALAGVACVAEAAMNLDDMMRPPKVVYVPKTTLSDSSGYTLEGGFGVGVLAFFGMLFVGVGTGLASVSATTNPSTRRRVTAILALAWHGVGVGTCCCYCALAPALDVWPFLLVMAYLWLGLVPLALAIPDDERTGWLRSAVWHAMGGGFLGGVVGAVIGGVVGGVAVLVSNAAGSQVIGTNWWLFAAMGGGLATGIVFAVRRLAGWEMSSGEEEEEGDEEKGRESPTAHSVVCRKCRMPVDSGFVECPCCRTPVRARRDWPIKRILTGTGVVCVVGSWGRSLGGTC